MQSVPAGVDTLHSDAVARVSRTIGGFPELSTGIATAFVGGTTGHLPAVGVQLEMDVLAAPRLCRPCHE